MPLLNPFAPLRAWLVRPPRRPARPRFRPAVQQLEDRALPSTAVPPTIDLVSNQTVLQDTNGGADHTITLSGISPGAGFHQFNVQINWDRADIIPQNDFVFGNFSGGNPQSVPLTFTTAADTSGTVHVTVTVTDTGAPDHGESPGSTQRAFDVIVNPVADAPTANALTVAVGGGGNGLQLSATDPDGDGGQPAVTFSIATQPAHGTLSNLNPATGAVTYTPNPGYNGPDSFTFTATDGPDSAGGLHDSTGTVSLTVVQPGLPPPPVTGPFFKGFQLFINRRRPLASKLRLDFGANPSVQGGVFRVTVGTLSFKVRVAVTQSGADTFVDLSVIPPKGNVALTPRLLRQLQGAAATLVGEILVGGL
jgi:hypothetical protein